MMQAERAVLKSQIEELQCKANLLESENRNLRKYIENLENSNAILRQYSERLRLFRDSFITGVYLKDDEDYKRWLEKQQQMQEVKLKQITTFGLKNI